jgi:hypothetical protein
MDLLLGLPSPEAWGPIPSGPIESTSRIRGWLCLDRRHPFSGRPQILCDPDPFKTTKEGLKNNDLVVPAVGTPEERA